MEYSSYENNTNCLERTRLGDKIYSKAWLYVLRGLCVAVIMGICAVAGLGLGAFTGLLKGVEEFTDASDLGITGFTTTVYDCKGREVIQLSSGEDRVYITADEIPQYMKDAVVAIEDERFYTHNGIDMKGILRAGYAIFRSGDDTAQGGSTLTQQVVKQLLLNPSQNIQRKIREWYLALEVEDVLTEQYGHDGAKNLILELYLNYNFLGNNCYGIQKASHFYFDKEAQEMNLAECALIAGLFQAPSAFDPTSYPEDCRVRQVTVLQKMRDLGFITQEEYDEAYNDDVFSRIANNYQAFKDNSSDRVWSYFLDTAVKYIIKDMESELGLTNAQAWNRLYYGGLSIYLTQDNDLQDIVDRVFEEYASGKTISSGYSWGRQQTYYQVSYNLSVYDPKDRTIVTNYPTFVGLYSTKKQAQDAADAFRLKYVSKDARYGYEYIDDCVITMEPQYAFTLYDYHNGEVKAIAGGRGEKTTNMSTNRATDTVRQPGSTFKLIAAYSNAVENGAGTGSVVDDSPFMFWDWAPTAWWGENSTSSQPAYYGLVTFRQAIARSNNIAAARVNTGWTENGVDDNFEMAEKYGFTSLRDYDDVADGNASDHVGSLCLGSCSVTQLELAAAYGAMANGGVRYDPIFYTRVLDYEGNILLEEKQTSSQVLSETSAWILSDMLRTNVKGDNGGTASYDNFTDKAFYKNATGREYKGGPQAVGGKTGSSENESDEVFVGFSNYYVGAVWAGFDYYTYQNDKDPWKHMTYAHRLFWMRIMAEVHENLDSKTSFARPSGLVSVNTCAMSGMLATSACSSDPMGSQIVTEWYAKGTEPKDRCDKHVACTFCTESGLYPSADCTSVATGIRFQRTREQLDAIQEALEYFRAENRKKYNAANAAKTPENFDYSKIEDWPYMAPWCYDILCAKAGTLTRVWTMGGSSRQTVDLGMNWFEGADVIGEDGAGPVYQFDNSSRMICPYDSMAAFLMDHPEFVYNPAGGNVVFDVSLTHVCPLCSFRKLVEDVGGGEEPGEESGESGEEPGEESGEESHSSPWSAPDAPHTPEAADRNETKPEN